MRNLLVELMSTLPWLTVMYYIIKTISATQNILKPNPGSSDQKNELRATHPGGTPLRLNKSRTCLKCNYEKEITFSIKPLPNVKEFKVEALLDYREIR